MGPPWLFDCCIRYNQHSLSVILFFIHSQKYLHLEVHLISHEVQKTCKDCSVVHQWMESTFYHLSSHVNCCFMFYFRSQNYISETYQQCIRRDSDFGNQNVTHCHCYQCTWFPALLFNVFSKVKYLGTMRKQNFVIVNKIGKAPTDFL